MKSTLIIIGIVLACSCQSTPEPEQEPSPTNDTTVNATTAPAADNSLTAPNKQKAGNCYSMAQQKMDGIFITTTPMAPPG